MSQWIGKATLSLTGTRRITLGGFLPTWAKIYIDEDNSGVDPNTHICIGETDGTTQSYESSLKNGVNEKYENGNDRIVKHFAYSGGFITPVEAEFLAFEYFAGYNTIKLNIISASSNYKVKIVCGD